MGFWEQRHGSFASLPRALLYPLAQLLSCSVSQRCCMVLTSLLIMARLAELAPRPATDIMTLLGHLLPNRACWSSSLMRLLPSFKRCRNWIVLL